MTITIELFEDSGAVTSSHGTLRQVVNNLGWKSSGSDETFMYVDYPLIRPDLEGSTYGVVSYTKYYYAKISGTYPNATRPRFYLLGDPAGTPPAGYSGTDKVRVYWELTNVYAAPANTFAVGSLYEPNSLEITPFLSTTGPEVATSLVNLLATDTTYYSCYLKTQLFVEPGAWDELGNIGIMQVKFTLDEYESTDI